LQGRAFAARGYYTFIVDYRKLPKHRYPAFVADAARAIAHIHKSLDRYPCADPQRLFVMGQSAGDRRCGGVHIRVSDAAR
jgi:acetyl esterase/lipase